MNITRIKKMSDGRYKIDLENKESIIVYEDVILEENILYKKELTKGLIDKITKRNDYYKLYNKTLKYIMTKIRSEKEIIDYLDKQQCSKETSLKIINKLKEIRMLNDDIYFKSYIADRVNLSTDGPNKIKEHLLKNNIESDKITKELQKYDEDFNLKLEKLILKKIKNPKKSEYELKQKLTAYFISLGYYKSEIEKILSNIKIDSSDALKHEYEKALKKLEKKYQNEELIFHIKNNLYKKGYKLDEINKVIK